MSNNGELAGRDSDAAASITRQGLGAAPPDSCTSEFPEDRAEKLAAVLGPG